MSVSAAGKNGITPNSHEICTGFRYDSYCLVYIKVSVSHISTIISNVRVADDYTIAGINSSPPGQNGRHFADGFFR